jgi:putative membrane protein
MLRRFGITWAFNVAALFVASWIVEGVSYGDKAWALFGAGLVFSLVNMLVKPIVKLLALPLIIITLGIALFFINLLMLYLTAWIVDDFNIDDFGSAAAATIVVWLVNTVLEAAFSSVARPIED